MACSRRTSPAPTAFVSSRLDEVTAEVRLWHGDRDVVPLDRAEFVAQAADGHRLIWADEGHCGFIRRWDQVLEDMLEGLR